MTPALRGVVELDLRRHVDGGLMDDTARQQVHRALADVPDASLIRVLLGHAHWIPDGVLAQLAESTTTATGVEFVGSDCRGVDCAIRGLRQLLAAYAA